MAKRAEEGKLTSYEELMLYLDILVDAAALHRIDILIYT